MKTIFIVRHGHAAGGNALVTDAQRLLTPRGEDEVRATAHRLRDMEPAPAVILASAAERARASAGILLAAVPEADLRVEVDLYGADPALWIQHLQGQQDQVAAVLLVGHNPGLELLVQELTGSRTGFLPAALAHVDLPVTTWREVAANGVGRLVAVRTPGTCCRLELDPAGNAADGPRVTLLR